MGNTALLLVDFQNDYFTTYQGAKWQLQGTEVAADKAATLLHTFRQNEQPIIHIRHEFPTDEAPFFLPNSEGAQIHPSVSPMNDEPVIVKQHVSSFKQTQLRETLIEKGISKLVIVGAMSHNCIDSVVREASDLGYQIEVIHDACATLDLQFEGQTIPAAQVHAAFMAALAFGYCQVTSTEQYLSK